MSITVSNTGGTHANSAPNISLAFGSNISNGNRIVVLGAAYDGGSSSSPFVAGDCTKIAGTATLGSIALDVQRSYNHFGSECITVGIWSAQVTGSGSCTMQVDNTGSYFLIALAELSSGLGLCTLDTGKTSTNVGASGAPDSGSVTPSSADAVFFGALVTSASTTPTTHTEDAAFSLIYEDEAGASDQTGSFIYRIVTSIVGDSASWTAPTTVAWNAIVAAYIEPGGGGGSGISLNFAENQIGGCRF